jgi:hexokinase
MAFQGRLTQWTKGFSCSGVEGEDVVQLLREAIERHPKKINIDVCAILVSSSSSSFGTLQAQSV